MERVKIYARTIEEEAVQQINKMSRSEAYKDCTVRIMPDCHAGAGCTIGTVIGIKDRIVPNTVGVDIGCGMFVVPLGKNDIDLVQLDKVIRCYVPSGFNIHKERMVSDYIFSFDKFRCRSAIDEDMAYRSIGSLGGCNHFIEIDEDADSNKFLVIHSGSRNLGVRVCKHYQDKAVRYCRKKQTDVSELIAKLKAEGREKEINATVRAAKAGNTPIDPQLAYLEGDDMQDYLNDMKLCQHYATINRHVIARIIGCHIPELRIDEILMTTFPFHTVHNYIDHKLNILRKGAVSAQNGERLIIPMNMRDGSLLCIGKGNIDWLYSAPHGAGRLMSRKKAKETLEMGEFEQSMKGIYTTSVCEDTIDESPMVYKPMDEIIECVKDAVEIETVIKPIYNFKAKE